MMNHSLNEDFNDYEEQDIQRDNAMIDNGQANKEDGFLYKTQVSALVEMFVQAEDRDWLIQQFKNDFYKEKQWWQLLEQEEIVKRCRRFGLDELANDFELDLK